MKNNFHIIVTVGPSIDNNRALKEMSELGIVLFRVNGAHISENSISRIGSKIKKINPKAKILMDLPGNKIRTKNLKEPISLKRNRIFKLTSAMVTDKIFFKNIKVGDIIYAHDSLLSFEVIKKRDTSAVFRAHSTGMLNNGKGLHKAGLTDKIDFLTERDKELIDMARKSAVDCIALSYVRNKDDIRAAKNHILVEGYEPEIFVKLETKKAMDELEGVLAEGDAFILDRGDLSSEIGLENIAFAQDALITKVKAKNKKIFLATQFLKNMIYHPVPLIAETNDVFNAIRNGVNGIQLSDETAIGRYPADCVKFIMKIRKSCSRTRRRQYI